MPDFIFLMHDDVPARGSGHADAGAGADADADWGPYLAMLEASGNFQGGSAIGAGVCARKSGAAPSVTAHLSGFIRVAADNLDAARSMLAGNPVFEAGGTVEIRELPRTG